MVNQEILSLGFLNSDFDISIKTYAKEMAWATKINIRIKIRTEKFIFNKISIASFNLFKYKNIFF